MLWLAVASAAEAEPVAVGVEPVEISGAPRRCGRLLDDGGALGDAGGVEFVDAGDIGIKIEMLVVAPNAKPGTSR